MGEDLALAWRDDEPYPQHERQGAKDADLLVAVARLEPLTDGGLRTSRLLSKALERAPDHHEARILQERLHQMLVPRWHFPMLADKVRNRAYAEAIAAKVRPGDIVLDIGCGAGLTAMLAARAGAKHVYACEQQPLIAEAAARVIERNGLADRITVIAKSSRDLVIGVDLPEPADVVVSEIVDSVLLGEGALATLEHAMRELARPEARAVPERGVLKARLVESPKLMEAWRPREAEGFDLSAFHPFATVARITPSDHAAWEPTALGPAEELFAFDFTRPAAEPGRTVAHLRCSRAGVAHAVLVHFELDLAEGVRLTNDLEADGHWGRTAFLLDRPAAAAPGDALAVTVQHDAAQLSVSAAEALHRTDEGRRRAPWIGLVRDRGDAPDGGREAGCAPSAGSQGGRAPRAPADVIAFKA